MIISIWRYSHLALAISSFAFIFIASVTGIILALEPIVEQVKPYAYDIEKYDLASTISVLEEKYEEIITLEKDHNDFVIASVITKEGTNELFYIDPATGKKVGNIIEKASIFQFSTNLHRSLFLKSTGRAIIGIVSFLLFLIATTGILLIAKRQGGISKLFSKVVKEDVQQYYHVVLGRYSLVPVIILTLTGVYLSLEKFSLLPEQEVNHDREFPKEATKTKIQPKDLPVFQNISLKNIKLVEFPFSDDPEDYFLVNLKSKELVIHQYTGAILSEVKHPFVTLTSSLSMKLHTGRGSILWSLILFIATSSILYFIYSGFSMTLKRRKKNSFIPQSSYDKDVAEYVILVGSETGSTYKSARLVFDAIQRLGKKVFITELNKYDEFKKMKHLIIFTSTYGTGEAPTNANHFLEKFANVKTRKSVNYSVIGLGSLAYSNFCEFASHVDVALQNNPNFKSSTPLHKIHNQSFEDIQHWAKEWGHKVGLPIELKTENQKVKAKKQQDFTIINRTELNTDDTFLLQLRPERKTSFQSGDLLVYQPDSESAARFYSIGIMGKDILLSIKKHEFGVCSTYFSQLNAGDRIKAKIQKNKGFHFPRKAKEIILISNGTGIAPFLGMLQENYQHKKVHLFWGGRTKTSFNLYQETVRKVLSSNQLTSLRLAYSREGRQKEYVQDVLSRNTNLIAEVLLNNGSIMICGSLAMEKGVLKVLRKISTEKLHTDFRKIKQQIQTDCY